jgi:hypothetical protein
VLLFSTFATHVASGGSSCSGCSVLVFGHAWCCRECFRLLLFVLAIVVAGASGLFPALVYCTL